MAASTPRTTASAEVTSASSGGVAVTAADREELVMDTLILQEKLCELSQQLETFRKANIELAGDVALLREAKKRLATLPPAVSSTTGR